MALSIVPEHPNYLFSLAKNCQENGNKDKARSSLEKGIKSFEKENDQNLSDHFGIQQEKIPEMKEIIKNYKRLDMNLKEAY